MPTSAGPLAANHFDHGDGGRRLGQVFVHGLMHADPHPGNVLLTTDGRLTLLDLGMVAHVPPRMRDQLLKLRLAIVTLVASSLFNDRKTRPKEERYPI